MKWRSALGVLCDSKILMQLKGKLYKTAIRPGMLYDTDCWAIKKQYVHKMKVVEMRTLRWVSGNTRKDTIQNEEIILKIGVAPIDEKMRESHLKQFGHVQRREINAFVMVTCIIDGY